MRHPFQCAIAIAPLAALLSCAHAARIDSVWPAPAIAVDGAYADWAGRLVRLDERRSVALGVANDEANLYLCLVTRDFEIQSMILRSGLTVWIDPEGGRRKRIGFRIAPVEPSATAAAPAYVELVFDGAEYGEQLVASAEDAPVEVRSAAHADVAAYEIRIALGTPLGASSARLRVSLRLAPGSDVGLGFETDALPVGRSRDPRRGDPRNDEAAADPEDGVPLLRRTQRYEPMRAWVVARLAAPAD